MVAALEPQAVMRAAPVRPAREWVFRALIVMSRRRVIVDHVRGVTKAVVFEDRRILRRHMVGASVQACLHTLLAYRPGGVMTHLEWLPRPPRKRSLKTVRERFNKY